MKINDQTTEATYATSDLGIAAVLVSQGHSLIRVDKSNPRRVLFCFLEVTDIEQVTEQFWARKLDVDACTLVENMKLLKGRIYGS